MKNTVRLFFGIFTAISVSTQAQTISTVAGNGTGGFAGDGGAATAANINAPSSVAVDGSGNVYIADQYNNRIRKVSGGNISTIAGNDTAGYTGDGGAAVDARLNHPAGMTLDAAGNLYFADQENNVIRKISSTGTITTVAGNGMRGFSGDGDTATHAMLNQPAAVAVDDSGNIYIADTYNQRIRKVDATGMITTLVGNGYGGYNGETFPYATQVCVNYPEGIAVGPDGNVYIADSKNNRVRMYDVTTQKVVPVQGIFAGPSAVYTNMTLKWPSSISFDAQGTMYIADEYHYVIKRLKPDGYVWEFAGNSVLGYSGDDGDAKNAMVSLVKGIASDAAGNLYIADWGNNRVRYVTAPTAAGNVNTERQGLSIQPNPATGGTFNVTLTTKVAEKGIVTVTDVTGKVVYNAAVTSNTTKPISLKQAAGTYIVNAKAGDKTWSEKIVITN